MHFTKKATMIGSIIMLACCFTGCEKEVITVAGIQNPEVREDQYIVVENFELKQIEDNGKDAIACCAILIPAGYVESSTVPGMYVHSLSPLDSSNIYYTVLEGTGDGAVPDNLTSDSFEKELKNLHEMTWKVFRGIRSEAALNWIIRVSSSLLILFRRGIRILLPIISFLTMSFWQTLKYLKAKSVW